MQNDYQIQSFLSDYILQSGVWAFYYAGLLNVPPIKVPLSTTEIDIALLGKLTRNGFALGMPCKAGMRAIGEVPKISLSRSHGLSFNSQLAFDIVC